MSRDNNMTDIELAVCLGWDAFRILIGQKPKRFTAEQVIEAIKTTVLHRNEKGTE